MKKRIYPKDFRMTGDKRCPLDLDFNFFGLHKVEVKDGFGDVIESKLYVDVEEVDGNLEYSKLAVKETKNITREPVTNKIKRIDYQIDWYSTSNSIEETKQFFEVFE